jgi:heat shock protein HtpX
MKGIDQTRPMKFRINRIWISLGVFSFFILALGYWFAGRFGLLFSFFAAASLNSLIFFYPDLRLAQLFPHILLEGQDPWGALRLTAQLASRAGIPTPRLYVIQLQTPTTYSAGTSRKSSAIFISEGLLSSFSSTELETVLALEIIRIRRSDTLAVTVGAALSSLLSVNPLRWMSAPFIGGLLRIPSRRRDFLEADLETGRFLSSPARVAEVLWKIYGVGLTRPFIVPPAYAHLFTVSPLTTPRWHSYFLLQPNVKKRITNLVGHWPL